MPVQVNVSDIIGPDRGPIITPAGTEALTEAFHKGFINADDIIERVSERTKAKKKLDLQLTNEALSPEAISARKSQQQLAGSQAQSSLALAPLAQQAKESELKAAIFDAQAKPGGYDAMQQALIKAGFPVTLDPNNGLTNDNKSEIEKRFAALVEYTQKRAEADERVKNTESKFFPTEQTGPTGVKTTGQLQKLFHNGQEVTSDQFKSWAQESEALKRTPFSAYYSLKSLQPGKAVASPVQPAAPVAQPQIQISPEQANAQRAQLFNAGVPNAASMTNQQVAAAAPVSIIQPTVSPSSAPLPVIGTTAPGIGIVTGTQEAATPKPVQMTAEQQKGLAQATTTASNFKDLAQSYENLNANDAWLTGPVMGRLYSFTAPQNWNKSYAEFVRAQTSILANLAKGIYHETGVLSDRDILRYKSALPDVKDTPDVARAKLAGAERDIYSSILLNIETMKGQGQVITPIINQIQKDAQSALTNRVSPVATQPSGSTGATTRVTLPGLGEVEFDPATQRIRKIQ